MLIASDLLLFIYGQLLSPNLTFIQYNVFDLYQSWLKIEGRLFTKCFRCHVFMNFLTGGKVILACRDLEKGQKTCEEIRIETRNRNVHLKKLDLASLKSVNEFAEDINKSEDANHRNVFKILKISDTFNHCELHLVVFRI